MGDSLRWIGHSTVLVELDGVRLLTDPLLRERIIMLRRSEPLDLGSLEDLDAVLISHLHYDHLDLGSLRRLLEPKTVVVPRGAGTLLRRRVQAPVQELGVVARGVRRASLSIYAGTGAHWRAWERGHPGRPGWTHHQGGS